MGIVLLGHGGLELQDGYPDGMGVVAIGPGTTLQVYTDAGQMLFASGDDFKLLTQLDAPWGAMTSANVTYNLSIEYAEEHQETEDDDPGFFVRVLAPHTVVRAGVGGAPSPWLLCNGTPDTCPTDPRMSTGEVEGPREHTCTGILGTYKGQEIHWAACTSISRGGEAVDPWLGDAPTAGVLGVSPDDAVATWYRIESDNADDLPVWWGEQTDQVKDLLRGDPHIAEWERSL